MIWMVGGERMLFLASVLRYLRWIARMQNRMKFSRHFPSFDTFYLLWFSSSVSETAVIYEYN